MNKTILNQLLEFVDSKTLVLSGHKNHNIINSDLLKAKIQELIPLELEQMKDAWNDGNSGWDSKEKRNNEFWHEYHNKTYKE